MSDKIAQWDRPFRIWIYSISHSTLLLRSIGEDASPRRIDVAFFGVREICLRDEYPKLVIGRKESVLGSESAESSELLIRYQINGDRYHVVATNCAWEEDDGGYRSESRFGPLPGIL
jgi:hypothetical protein